MPRRQTTHCSLMPTTVRKLLCHIQRGLCPPAGRHVLPRSDARNMCRSMRSSIANHRLIVRSTSRPQGFARHTQWDLRPVALSTIIACFTSPHSQSFLRGRERRMPTTLGLHLSAFSCAVRWGGMRADASQKRDVVGCHLTILRHQR